MNFASVLTAERHKNFSTELNFSLYPRSESLEKIFSSPLKSLVVCPDVYIKQQWKCLCNMHLILFGVVVEVALLVNYLNSLQFRLAKTFSLCRRVFKKRSPNFSCIRVRTSACTSLISFTFPVLIFRQRQL